MIGNEKASNERGTERRGDRGQRQEEAERAVREAGREAVR